MGAACVIGGGVWLARSAPRSGVGAVGPSRPTAPWIEAPALELAPEAGSLAERRAPAPAVADPSAPRAEHLVLRLLDADGAPLAGIELLLADADGGAQRATTDAEGRGRFAPRAGSGAVYFQLPAYMPQRHELELAAGERRIELEPGAEVSGWVTVDGAVPERALELVLGCDRALFEGAELGAEVAEFLGLAARRSPTLRSSTDARGAFAFRGLEEDWSGGVSVPEGYALRQGVRQDFGERRVALARPQSGVAIDVERLPHLKGRLLEGDFSAPEGRAAVVGLVEWSDGTTLYTGAVCDAQGYFEIALREDGFRSVSLDAHSATGTAIVQRTRERIGDDLDLGDIVLGVYEELVFRALGPDGGPIAGALGRVEGGEELATTDASGSGRLRQVRAGRARLCVAARGYSESALAVDVPSSGPVLVTLARTNSLAIRLESPAELSAHELRVVLASGQVPLFPGHDGWFPTGLSARLHVGRSVAVTNDESGGSTTFIPDADGLIELQELAVGAPLTLAVTDMLETEILTQAIAPLLPEEQREVALRVADPGRSLAVSVRDPEGRALPGPMVRLSSVAGEAIWRAVDRSGNVVFEALAAERVHLRAELGTASVERRDLALSEGRTEVELVLEPRTPPR